MAIMSKNDEDVLFDNSRCLRIIACRARELLTLENAKPDVTHSHEASMELSAIIEAANKQIGENYLATDRLPCEMLRVECDYYSVQELKNLVRIAQKLAKESAGQNKGEAHVQQD